MWTLWIAGALAQTTPVPTGVVSLTEDGPCDEIPAGAVPRVIQSNLGLITARGDGAYTYVCPARFGGEAGGATASTPDGRQILVAGISGAWLSTDSGCSATALDLPDTGVAIDVLYWRQAFWILHRDVSMGMSSLFRTDGTTLSTVASWTDFNPDGMVAEGSDHLWLAGASPLGVRRLGFLGGLSGNEPLEGLPDDVQQVRTIVPVAARGGEAWIRLERQTSQWAWHASVRDDGSVRFTDTSDRPRVMLGPIWINGGWISALDLVLHWTDPDDPSWTPTAHRVDWTCLQTLGDRAYACVFDGLRSIEGFTDDVVPIEVDVFAMSQLAGLNEACGYDQACEAEWLEAGEALGLLDADEPAVCPDGQTASDLDPSSCQCTTGAPIGAGWLALWGLLVRARRHGSNPDGHASSTRPSQS